MSGNEPVLIAAKWVLHVLKPAFLPTKCLDFPAVSLNNMHAFCDHVRHEGTESINWIIFCST